MNQNPEGVRDTEYLVFYEFPIFILTGPLIVLGLMLAGLHTVLPGTITEERMALWWLLALMLTCLVAMLNFSRTSTVILFLSIVVLVLVGMLLGLHIFSFLNAAVDMLDMRMSAGSLMFVSVILGIVFLGMLCNVWFNHRYVAAGDIVFRKRPFEDQLTLPLTALHPPQKHIEDFFEYMIFGMGTVILYDTNGREYRISRVLRVNRVIHILSQFTEALEVEEDQRKR